MVKMRELLARARRHEQAGDLARAIESYQEALALQEETDGAADLGLYNRLGDLYLRNGNRQNAVEAFDRAATQYESQQLYSNAIALCKKILRYAPDALAVHRRVGRLLALSGLTAEARVHYLAYAGTREREGAPGEGADALLELLEVTSDEDTRLAAADLLHKADRAGEAVEQLQRAWRATRKRGGDAGPIRDRILGLDPEADPLAAAEAARREGEEAEGEEPLHGEAPAAGESGRSGSGSGDGIRVDPEAVAEPPGDPLGRAGAAAGDPPGALGDSGDRAVEVEELAAELQRVLGGLEGEERMRRALPILEQLVRAQPERVDLLQRKLTYALALDEEEVAIEAYLALGSCLERRLTRFSLRFLTTSSTSGGATTAVMLGERPAAGVTE